MSSNIKISNAGSLQLSRTSSPTAGGVYFRKPGTPATTIGRLRSRSESLNLNCSGGLGSFGKCGEVSDWHIPLIVRLHVGKSLEECRSGGGVFFLFGSFSFFTIACGNVGKSRGNNCRARLRMNSPTTGWLQGDFRIWPELEAKRMLRCCPSRTRL